MKNNRGVAMTLLVVISLPACQLVIPSPIPPPGWRTPVRDLIVGDGAFPLDWTAAMDTSSDPTVNHVGRIWSNPLGSRVDEGIWRAYTEADAKEKYAELLRQSIFHASQSIYVHDYFVQFEPPTDIVFVSHVADESYFACGWVSLAYCELVARYRNYVVAFQLDRQVERQGHQSAGLTDKDIETLVTAADVRFAEQFDQLPTPAPDVE